MSDEHIHREFEKDALFSILSETEKLANVGGWEWDMVKDEWTFQITGFAYMAARNAA